MIDIALWWIGLLAWIVAGTVAFLFRGEHLLNWILLRLRLKADFLRWCLQRAKKHHTKGQ